MFLYNFKVQLDQGEWGSDLPSVESHLENHRNVHQAIEDFQMSIKEARMSEVGFDSYQCAGMLLFKAIQIAWNIKCLSDFRFR